jgi:SSS family solute:Na+ symporter
LSTVFTLDIYCKYFKKNADQKQKNKIGRYVTCVGGLIAIGSALAIAAIPDKGLFEKLLTIIQFLAPPLASVFIVGVCFKRANSISALLTLIVGGIASVGVGIAYLFEWPSKEVYPHFMFLSFLIFAALVIFMIIVALLTQPDSKGFPTLKEALAATNTKTKDIWLMWAGLAVIMLVLYLIFN